MFPFSNFVVVASRVDCVPRAEHRRRRPNRCFSPRRSLLCNTAHPKANPTARVLQLDVALIPALVQSQATRQASRSRRCRIWSPLHRHWHSQGWSVERLSDFEGFECIAFDQALRPSCCSGNHHRQNYVVAAGQHASPPRVSVAVGGAGAMNRSGPFRFCQRRVAHGLLNAKHRSRLNVESLPLDRVIGLRLCVPDVIR